MRHPLFRPTTFFFSYTFLTCLLVLFSAAAPGNGDQREAFPVNPRTVPEYDTVAGVVMYWNPGSPSYDQIVAAVVNGIQPRATVFLQTNSPGHRDQMIATLNNHGVPLQDIVFIDVFGDRIWIRDHGPFSIYDDNELAFVGFNDLATNHGDQDLPQRLAEYWELNYYDFSHIIFDGGNYLVDSHNQLYATDRLYTSNPSVDPAEIDGILENYMGITEIHTFSALSSDYWGHLDMQIKLLNDTTFIISTVDQWHADYQILQDNLAILEALEHPEGKPYQIVQIPKAENWKTYINSLIVNDAVLVPIYNDPRDVGALAAYEELMPGTTVIGIDCNAMIHWEGAIHCITNQLPPFHDAVEPEPVTLTFAVRSPAGTPLHDAVISINGQQYPPGHYVFPDMEPGTYSFTTELFCYGAYSGEITIHDQDLTVEVHLPDVPGDANGDGVVDVLDVVAITHHFMMQDPDPFCPGNADINGDGAINVLDVIGTVDVYMGRGLRGTDAGRGKGRSFPAPPGEPAKKGIGALHVTGSDDPDIRLLSFDILRQDDYTVAFVGSDGKTQREISIPAWVTGTHVIPIDVRTLQDGLQTVTITGTRHSRPASISFAH